jgi:hypothetical protein
MSKNQPGQRITLTFEGREFDVIVINPNGLGPDQPSVGFGFNMMEKHAGISESTLSDWVTEVEGATMLKLPSSKLLRVTELLGIDGNGYSVIEATDWFELAVDLLVNPGQTGKREGKGQGKSPKAGKTLREKLGDFLLWFAVKGFYAEAYVALKGVYTEKDSRATTAWLEMRQLGKIARKIYTDLLQAQGCEGSDYAYWTDYVYTGLFGEPAWRMKQIWELMNGNPKIARNYIPKAEGLDAVRHCEDMTVRMFVDDLHEAHDQAINLTRRKFLGGA